jgi:hypothetical protein
MQTTDRTEKAAQLIIIIIYALDMVLMKGAG